MAFRRYPRLCIELFISRQCSWLCSNLNYVVFQVPELRLLFPNGSLVFPPFPNERYRHDVHATLYRCKLKSALGTVISREVHVKAGEL